MPLDPVRWFYEVGRQVQAVSVAMRKHEVVDTQQLCACGRLRVRVLPVFGMRCDIACAQWDLACESVRRIVECAVPGGPLWLAVRRSTGRVPDDTSTAGRTVGAVT